MLKSAGSSTSWPVSVTQPKHLASRGRDRDAVGAVFCGASLDRRRATSSPMFALLSAAWPRDCRWGPSARAAHRPGGGDFSGPFSIAFSRRSVMVAAIPGGLASDAEEGDQLDSGAGGRHLRRDDTEGAALVCRFWSMIGSRCPRRCSWRPCRPRSRPGRRSRCSCRITGRHVHEHRLAHGRGPRVDPDQGPACRRGKVGVPRTFTAASSISPSTVPIGWPAPGCCRRCSRLPLSRAGRYL